MSFQPTAYQTVISAPSAPAFQTGAGPAPPTPLPALGAIPGTRPQPLFALGPIGLAQLLAANQADALTLRAYFDDAMVEVARSSLFIETRLIALSSLQVGDEGFQLDTFEEASFQGSTPFEQFQATVVPPEPTVRIVAICYDDRDLAATPLLDLEALTPQWRDRTGTPVAYTQEDEIATEVQARLIPVPTVPSKGFAFIHGEPLGIDFPAYVAAVFLCEARTAVPPWLDLPIAFGMLAREFGRDSAHMDPEFAAACQQFSQLFLGMVIVDAA